jgi:SAM-dependent methyltransferase
LDKTIKIPAGYPSFAEIIDLIAVKSPLQKKRLEKYLSSKDDIFFTEAEQFANDYAGYLKNQGMNIEYAISAYLRLCNDMLKAQIRFMKTGTYPFDASNNVINQLYEDETEMKSYMIGLALSQFLWGTHYDIYSFFENSMQINFETIHTYLEVGPGHGLFLNKALDFLDERVKITAIDLSPISLNITKSIIGFFKPQRHNIKYLNADILQANIDETFDFIVMGEVLEHVESPNMLLLKISELLDPHGRAFISSCVNCPAVDHVYHFKTVNEIRELFAQCNLQIQRELVLPVENLPMKEIIEKKITINYCSIIQRKSV